MSSTPVVSSDTVPAGTPTTVFQRRFMPAFLLAAVLPLVVLGLFLLVNLATDPENGARMLKVLPAHVVPFGSETSAGILVFQGVPLALIIVFLTISDMATSLPFIALATGARQVPVLGRYIVRLETQGAAFYNKHDWLRRAGLVGLAAFVALPLAGTGSTVGVLIGRASGLPSLVVATCVATGALVRWVLLVGAVAGVSLLL